MDFDQDFDHTANKAGDNFSPGSLLEEPTLLVIPPDYLLESKTAFLSPAGSGALVCAAVSVPNAKTTLLLTLILAKNQSGFKLGSMTTQFSFLDKKERGWLKGRVHSSYIDSLTLHSFHKHPAKAIY